ncbi:MAG: hypothetical protein ABI566_11015 [Pseudolysinimonas sp.]
MNAVNGCGPCALEQADDDAIVWRDDVWSCEIPTGLEAPGWFFLRLRRHAEGWAELTADEAAAFGAVSQRLETAIREATGAPKVYFMSFGENHPHFHFLVIARPADLEPDSRGAAIVAHLGDFKDPAASLEVAARVREAFALASPK